ncbi:MAG: undecaprenyl/decaprenyl-phosphate alpha-N-acetylglucosaminyl 1-phosphate transferase [Acidobacteria bacterium]|nr:undecaprenyl/decaprenyl-phosphate alpha-N-acetylglucosaminyl 1-phosphate transferase [Acidobacteriota bacterium]
MSAAGGYALVVLQTFVVAALATWTVRGVARRRGWLAPTRPDRWHSEPTALYGGVGIFAGFALGLLWHVPWSPYMATLLVLTGAMFATGLVDDALDIRPQTKVGLQIAGGLLLYAGGFNFNEVFPWWFDLGVVVFWVVAITNAMNLLDNMNGLAAGTAVIAGLSRLMLSHDTGNLEGALASAVLVGAVLGFLVFNFPRASIFMGDGGSFTIGFALAALNLSNGQAYTKSTFSIFIFPVVALALPIFDTAFVSVVRYFSGRAISQGGRDHTSHRLVAIGLSETWAVVILWIISAASGVIAYLLYHVGFSYAVYAMAIVVLGLALFGIVLSRVRVYAEGAAPDGPAAAWGFTLRGELLYKRQILWVLLDAITVVLVLGAVLPVPTGAASSVEASSMGVASAASAASVLMGLFALGLYRWDWIQFGWPVLARVIAGALLGVVAIFIWERVVAVAVPSAPLDLAAAWLAIIAAICGTRILVRGMDAWLHRLGGRRG